MLYTLSDMSKKIIAFGASNSDQSINKQFPLFGANIIASFHLPSFNHYFKGGQIINEEQQLKFKEQLNEFQLHLDGLNELNPKN